MSPKGEIVKTDLTETQTVISEIQLAEIRFVLMLLFFQLISI